MKKIIQILIVCGLVGILFVGPSALFADEFSEFESVVKSKKMACFYEIGGNPATINYRYDGTNLFYNQEVFGEGRINLNEVKQKPGKDIFIWKRDSIFGEIKTFIDFKEFFLPKIPSDRVFCRYASLIIKNYS